MAASRLQWPSDKELFLVAQLDPGEDDPDRDAMYDLGVIATAMQLLKLPTCTVRVLVEGVKRVASSILFRAMGLWLRKSRRSKRTPGRSRGAQALMRSVIDQFENYAQAKTNDCGPKLKTRASEIDNASVLADAVASNLSIKVADKQALLGELNAGRLEMVFAFMEGELGVLQVEKKIRSRVKRQMEKTQREYYLNEQLKAIQRELGNDWARKATLPTTISREFLRRGEFSRNGTCAAGPVGLLWSGMRWIRVRGPGRKGTGPSPRRSARRSSQSTQWNAPGRVLEPACTKGRLKVALLHHRPHDYEVEGGTAAQINR